jgi:hemolysin activation/secretion protein
MRAKHIRLLGLVAAASAICDVTALAQSASPPPALVPFSQLPSTTGHFQTSPIPGVLPQSEPKIVPPPALPGEPLPGAEGGPPVHITDIRYEGGTVYGNDMLGGMFGRLREGNTTQGQVVDAINMLQVKYREDGYFLTKVTGALEPAPGGGAVLVIHIIEGYISSVKLDNDVGPVGNLIYSYLRHLEGLRPLKITDLERYVLLSQNVPGMSIRTVLRPAKDQSGAVELIAELDRKRFDGYIIDDNRGPKTAGPNELLIGAAANSFTSLGERTELVVFNTPFDDEELFGQGSFEAMIGAQGLKLKAYAGYGILKPGDVLRPAGYKSRLLLTGLDAEYPVIRTRALSVYLDGDFDVSQSDIDLNDFTPTADHRASKSNLRILRFGARADLQDSLLGPALSAADSVNFRIHHGIPDLFSGTGDGSLRPARPNEVNDFTKLTLELQRTQQLYNWSGSGLSLYTAISGQWTSDILPPSEEFFLGGAQYGRGFYNGEATGDRAVVGTIELRFNDKIELAMMGMSTDIGLQYYAFFDDGQTYSLSVGDLSHHLESAGIGIRAALTENLSAQLEGVKRFTRRPTGTNTSLEPAQALFFRISSQF